MHIQKTHHTCGEECKRTVGSLIWSSESPHRPAPSIASLAPQAKTFFLLNKSWPHLLFPKVFFFSTHTYSTSNWLVNRKGERSHRFQSCSFLSIDQRGGGGGSNWNQEFNIHVIGLGKDVELTYWERLKPLSSETYANDSSL